MKHVFGAYTNLLKVLFIAFVYFILAVVSLPLSFHSSNATPVWPASGFAFAMLLLWTPKVSPGIFAGAFAANLFVFLNHHDNLTGNIIWISLLIGIGNTAEALAGYYLLRKFIPGIKTSGIYKRVHSVNWFVIAALLMCFASCTVGTTAILLGGIIPANEFGVVWFTWWTGDVAGILLTTPLILTWSFDSPKPVFRRGIRIIEMLFILTAIIITSGTVFENLFYAGFVFTRAFIIMPFLIWAAIRLDQKLVTILVLLSATIAITGTLQGIGPFTGPTLNESLLTAEAFISINSVMALLLSAAISERKEKEVSLSSSKDYLETIVAERTKELHERNEQLQKRNNELTLFSYAISHDLQEPLRKIEFFSARVLEDENTLSEKGKDYFQRIRLTTLRMKQLIGNLLSYSIADNSKKVPEKTDLNWILQQTKNDLAEKIQQTGAVIECRSLPVIRGISMQLQELFTNILSNSIKFRKPNQQPHILIQCEIVKGSALDNFDGVQDEEYYHLSFIDNGIGFEQEYANIIFEILQKLHGQNEYEGTGIGLAICKKVVENHNGFIAARGVPGTGCTIHVYLPARKTNYLDDVFETSRKQREYS